jgi:[acyl-carrier-protein] S-malonyltransferase
MDAAGSKAGPSGMSAILFLDPSKVDEVLASSGIKDVYAANYNSPVQVVISGTEKGIARAEEALKAAGAKKVVRLRVSGPFHTPLMQYARDGLQEVLQDVEFSNPKIPLFSNVTGSRVASGAEARRLAVEQVVCPVKWTAEEEAIKAEGFDLCIESGPGTVLCGLWRAVDTKTPCLPSGNLDQLSAIGMKEG